jgi:hypothetical protein
MLGVTPSFATSLLRDGTLIRPIFGLEASELNPKFLRADDVISRILNIEELRSICGVLSRCHVREESDDLPPSAVTVLRQPSQAKSDFVTETSIATRPISPLTACLTEEVTI